MEFAVRYAFQLGAHVRSGQDMLFNQSTILVVITF